MHRSSRLMLLAATVLVALAASAAPALAGQIVYSAEPADGDAQIRVMNDDGSNDRLLVHEDDIPGAESVYRPYVSPNGSTVVFQARTPSPGGFGLYCGFRCSAVYAYSEGVITRLSQAPTDCPPGDLCFGLDTDPQITGGGGHLFYSLLYGEPSGSGTPSTITTTYYRSIAGDEVEVPQSSCGKGGGAAVNPAADGQFATSVYCVGSGSSSSAYSLKIQDMEGNEETLGFDDYEFADVAFRGDGEVLVGAEDGNDPGLWLYPRDGSGVHRIAAAGWDSDHRPFETSPTFVGDGEIAFVYGDEIRKLPTSCDSCAIGSAPSIGGAKDIDGIAWTAQSIPDPAVAPPADNGTNPGATPGGNVTPKPPAPTQPTGPVSPPLPLILKAPAKLKLGSVLGRGMKVPFVATKTGELKMQATITPALARKLRLARKAKKPVVVARGTTNVTKTGEAIVTLKFTAGARKRLKKAKSVPLKLAGTFAGSPIAGQTRLAR